MAELRLVLLVAGACACRAEAAPPGLAMPAGWQPQPALTTAIGDAVKPAAVEAWGEPAMGCYAASVRMKGGRAKGMLDDVQKLATVKDVVQPDGDGVLSFGFDKVPYHGRVRALIGAGDTDALMCFWNDREPAACDAACTHLIGSMKP